MDFTCHPNQCHGLHIQTSSEPLGCYRAVYSAGTAWLLLLRHQHDRQASVHVLCCQSQKHWSVRTLAEVEAELPMHPVIPRCLACSCRREHMAVSPTTPGSAAGTQTSVVRHPRSS